MSSTKAGLLDGCLPGALPVVLQVACTYPVVHSPVHLHCDGCRISHFGYYPPSWLTKPTSIAGAALFLTGLAINVWADSVLIGLRSASSDRTYKIPSGFLYNYVSCPNYLGEMIEWAGWALATHSLAGLAFFWYTAANLVPRALANHAWCQHKFDDYPSQRTALIPYLL